MEIIGFPLGLRIISTTVPHKLSKHIGITMLSAKFLLILNHFIGYSDLLNDVDLTLLLLLLNRSQTRILLMIRLSPLIF